MKDSDYAMLRVKEIIDDMTQALTSLAKNLNNTTLMINCIDECKKSEKIKDEYDALKKALDAKQKEYAALLKHRNLLSQFIKDYECRDDATKSIIANTVLTLFVAFNTIQEEALESKE